MPQSSGCSPSTRLAALLEDALDLGVGVEVRRAASTSASASVDAARRAARAVVDLGRRPRRGRRGSASTRRPSRSRAATKSPLLRLVERGVEHACAARRRSPRPAASVIVPDLDEALARRPRARVGFLSMSCVHQRLREARLVALVVAVAAVAVHVDDDVLAEALAELDRELRRPGRPPRDPRRSRGRRAPCSMRVMSVQ